MSGFNGAISTPINSNSAAKQRATLGVSSTTEMNTAITQATAKYGKLRIYSVDRNVDTFDITLDNTGENHYRYGLLLGQPATNPSYGFAYLIWIGTNDPGTQITAAPIYKGSGAANLTISRNLNNLTFTFDSVQYGGIRLIWLE